MRFDKLKLLESFTYITVNFVIWPVFVADITHAMPPRLQACEYISKFFFEKKTSFFLKIVAAENRE